MFWPTDKESGNGELTGPDRLKPDVQNRSDSALGHNARVFSDSRTQDSLTLLLPGVPSLGAPPHKGKLQPRRCRFETIPTSLHKDATSGSNSGILKKKQLSPIVERNCPSRVHKQHPCGDAPGSPRGSSSSEGRAKTSLPEPLNGVALTIKAGTVDGDSSGSE